MPGYMESYPGKMKGRRPGYQPSLDFINEDKVDRGIIRNNTNSPLLRVEQNGSLVSSESGVQLDERQQNILTHNRFLEARMSMSILNHPEAIGNHIDAYAEKLAKIFTVLKDNTAIRGQSVTFGGQPNTLGGVFIRTTFTPLKSTSDQIGRMPEGDTTEEGNTTAIENWIIKSLNTKLSETGEDRWKLFLTKIKALSSFGTTLWQLLTVQDPTAMNRQAIQNLIIGAGLASSASAADVFDTRFQEFRDKTRSTLFDDSVTRARSERMPLIDGAPIRGEYSDAAEHGLGFGQVVQKAKEEHVTEQLRALLDAGGRNLQINAIKRENAPILNKNRPFMLSEKEFDKKKIPAEYEKFDFRNAVKGHYFNHGVGINRWQPYGIYGMDANRSGYPSAGAQSGGTTDVMLALTMLDLNEESSLYGKEDTVLCMTVAVAAFMNFGGYHTFSEVLPIGQAIAKNIKFIPTDVSRNFRSGRLYKDMQKIYETYGNDSEYQELAKFEAQHRKLTLADRHLNSNNTAPDMFQPVYRTRLIEAEEAAERARAAAAA